MNTRRCVILAALLALGPVLPGCGGLSFLAEMTGRLTTPEPTTTPVYSLAGKSMLILVDASTADLAEEFPQVPHKIATALARELGEKRAAAAIVNPHDLAVAAQSDPAFSRKSVVDIGRDFKVDLVLDVIVQGYVLSQAAAAETFQGHVGLGLRVIDVQAGRQVWPEMNQLYSLEAGSVAGITADAPAKAEQIMLQALARKVGMLFVPYDVNSLPLSPEVR